MGLVYKGYFHFTDIKKLFSETEKKGYDPLKKSGEQSWAILTLLFYNVTKRFIPSQSQLLLMAR